MDVCFVLLLVCLYICVCLCLLQNKFVCQNNIHGSGVHFKSAVRFGQALPGYLITAHHLFASLIDVEVIESLAVWRAIECGKQKLGRFKHFLIEIRCHQTWVWVVNICTVITKRFDLWLKSRVWRSGIRRLQVRISRLQSVESKN